jgi:hypothetical protein
LSLSPNRWLELFSLAAFRGRQSSERFFRFWQGTGRSRRIHKNEIRSSQIKNTALLFLEFTEIAASNMSSASTAQASNTGVQTDATPTATKRGQKRAKTTKDPVKIAQASGDSTTKGDVAAVKAVKPSRAEEASTDLPTEVEVLEKMASGDYFLKITKPQQVIAAAKRRKPLIYVQGLAQVSGSGGRKRRRSSKDEPKRMTEYNRYMKHRVHEIKEQTGAKHADAFLQAANEWKSSPLNAKAGGDKKSESE